MFEQLPGVRALRHLQRYRHILGVLLKYGYGDVLARLKAEQALGRGGEPLPRGAAAGVEALNWAQRLARALEELGPTFIKVGQFLSTRADIIPPDLRLALSELQDRVEPMPFEEARRIVETELRAPLKALFKEFEPEPFAAASLGQTHKAVTAAGREVVVKVQRPGLRGMIAADLEILHHLAGLAERHLEGMRHLNPSRLVEEWANTLGKELDYSLEEAHMRRFRRQFAGDASVHVPRVHAELSSPRVLTMERVKGVKITDAEALKAAGFDPKKTARRLADLAMRQVFRHGFFHADPHPGNLRLLPKHVVCYLDYGMMGRMSTRDREELARLLASASAGDEAAAAESLRRLSIAQEGADPRELEALAGDLIEEHAHRPIKDIRLSKLLERCLAASTRQGLRLPPELLLLAKMLTTLEGVIGSLDPGLDLTGRSVPYVREALAARLSPRRIARETLSAASASLRLAQELPAELGSLIAQLRRGKTHFELKHEGLEPMLATHDQLSNRLAFSIVLAALIIGSSLIVLAGIPPLWRGIPVIGLGGYLLAALMGFWLLISILRHGRL